MMQNFLGAPYPIVKNALGLLRTQGDVDQIKSDLLVLLLTNPGERVMLSDYGTPLRSLIFDQNDTTLAAQATEMIRRSIEQWEPRVVISDIQVGVVTDALGLNSMDDLSETEHILSIKIDFFDPENIKEVQELRLELPLTNGA